MKKVMVMLGVAVCLCGCAKEDVKPEVTTATNSVSMEETTDNVVNEINEEVIIGLMEKNIECSLNIFGSRLLSRNDVGIEYEGRTLYQVDEARFADYAAFEEYLHSIYRDEMVDALIKGENGNAPIYVNVDGKLYVDISREGGKAYFVDWSAYGIEIKSQTDERCEFVVIARATYPSDNPTPEPYVAEGVAVFEDGKWVLERIIF